MSDYGFGEQTRAAALPPVPETAADRERRNPFYRYLVHLGLPMSASIALHAGVLVFLAVKAFDIARGTDGAEREWSGAVVNKDDMPSAFTWQSAPMLEAAPELTLPDDPSLDLSDFRTSTAVDLSELGKGEGSGEGDGAGAGAGFGLGEGELRLLGTGQGAGGAGTGGFGAGSMGGGSYAGHAGLWNLSIRANKVVFVVDYSGSIVIAVDDLKRELKRSIGRLVPAQSFDVILFYSTTGLGRNVAKTESFKGRLEPATEAARREFFHWIDRRAPQGETKPLGAIERALALEPEVLFLLSDGDFEDEVVDRITIANREARAKFFCFVFDETFLMDSSGLPPKDTQNSLRLKRIAEANGGQTKIVTEKDLSR